MERNIKLKVGYEFDDVKAQAKQKAEEAKQEFQKSLDGVDTSKINSEIDNSTEKLNEMSEKVDEVKEKINATDIELEPNLKTENIEQQAEAIQNEVQNTLNGVDTSNVDAEIQQNIDKIQELSAKIEAVRAKLNTMRNDTVDLSDVDFNRKYGDDVNWAEQYNDLEEQLESLNNQMDVQLAKHNELGESFNRLRATGNNAFGQIASQFTNATNGAQQANVVFRTLGPTIATTMATGATATATLNGVLTVTMSLLGPIMLALGPIIGLFQKLKQEADEAKKKMEETVKAFVQFEKKLALRVGSSVPVLKQVLEYMSDPKQLLKDIGQVGSTLSGSLKKLLSSVTQLVKNGISKAVSSIKSSIRSGISDLEQWQIAMGNTTNSISALKGSLDLLKTNIGASFAPILDSISPILLQLISILNQATITIGSFFAALGGKKKILVAKSTTSSLTDASTAANNVGNAADKSTDGLDNSYESLEKVEEGADDANSALKDFLGSYDELNVINKNSESGGGGGDSAYTGPQFEEIEIGEDIIELADMIRDAWDKADFTEVGQLIGRKLIEALKTADEWINKEGKPTAIKIGKSLATLFNGIFESVDEETGQTLGTILGTTIADGITMVLLGLDEFFKDTHWESVGQFIVDTINGVLDPENKTGLWDTLGDTIVDGLNAAVTVANTLLDPKNKVFENLGKDFHDILERVIRGDKKSGEAGFDFIGLGVLIANGITSQVRFASELLKDRRLFYELGSNLGESVNEIGDKMTQDNTWADLGGTIADGIMDAFLFVGGFLDNWNPQTLIDGLSTSINTAIKHINLAYIAQTLVQLATTLFDTLAGIVEKIDTMQLGTSLAEGIAAIDVEKMVSSFMRLSHSILKALADTLVITLTKMHQDGTFQKIGKGIADGLMSVDWTDVKNGFITALLEVFAGVRSGMQAATQTTFEQNTSNVVDKLLPESTEKVKGGVKNAISAVFGVLFPGLAAKNTELNTKAVDAAQVTAESYGNSLVGTTTEKLQGWPNSIVSEKLTSAETAGTTQAGTTGTNIANSLCDPLINTTEEKLKAWPNEVVETNLKETNTTAETELNTLKETTKGAFGGLSDIVVKAITGAKEQSKTQTDELHNNTVEAVEGIKKEVVGESGNGGLISTIVDGITGGFKTTADEVAGENGYAKKMQKGVETAASEMNKNTVEEVNEMASSVQETTKTMSEKVASNSDSSFETMKDKASTSAAGMNKDVTKEIDDLGSNVQTSTSIDIKKVTIEAFEEMAKRVAGNSETDTTAIVPKVKDVIIKCFEEMQKKIVDPNGYVPEIKKKTEDAFTEMKNKLVGPTGQGGLANDIKNYTLSAFRTLRTGMQTEYTFAANDLKDYVNISIYHINQLIAAYNALRAAASMSGLGGGSAPVAAVPKLATGAVIPPNQPFLAMLGDQRSGTNIEAPLSTIQEAVANVLEPYLAEIADNTAKTAEKDLTVRIGDRDIARANQRGQRMMGVGLRTL